MRLHVQDRSPRSPSVASVDTVLRLDELRRTFRQGESAVEVLKGASAEIEAGEAVALVGTSGSGKSTLLHTAGLLETADSGEVWIDGRNCSRMGDSDRTRVRRATMGFIYQFHQLLPEFSALENVMLPQLIRGTARRTAAERAAEILSTLGLAKRLDHRPAELSGGEQQRTAIARALATAPRLILADEPTGNLDPGTAEVVFNELITLIRSRRVAALIATHNMELAARMDRVLRMEGGRLVEIRREAITL